MDFCHSKRSFIPPKNDSHRMEHFRERQSFLSGACSDAIDSKDFLNGKYQKKRQSRSISKSQKIKTSSYHKYSGDSNNNCLTFNKKNPSPPKKIYGQNRGQIFPQGMPLPAARPSKMAAVPWEIRIASSTGRAGDDAALGDNMVRSTWPPGLVPNSLTKLGYQKNDIPKMNII